MRIPSSTTHWILGSCLVISGSSASSQPAAASAPSLAPSVQIISTRRIQLPTATESGRTDDGQQFIAFVRVSPDADYGVTAGKPMKVGVGDWRLGAAFAALYLRGLLGPSGEPTEFRHLGSCCAFQMKDGSERRLEKYSVQVDGAPAPVILFIDTVGAGPAVAPQGFTLRPNSAAPPGR